MARLALLTLLLHVGSRGAWAVDPDDARIGELANHPKWIALLHYRTTFFGAVRSEIDSPNFFLSKDGKANPEEELRATALALLDGIPADNKELICRFPARFDWLREELSTGLPGPESFCPAIRSKLKSFENAELSIVFAESYRTNPASMFGHSFFRFDNTTQARGSELLAPAISFAAKTDGEKGFFFAAKGLTGLYKGVFFHAPYHIRVTQYNDLDRRNLWEYHLNFSAKDIRALVLHLWEMENSHFDYYFFDENCSYHLLGALEAARPDLELRNKFFLFAIPTDTVRVVTESGGLLRDVTFRPSQATRVQQAESQLTNSEIDTVREISSGADFTLLDPLDDKRRAMVLETAVDLAILDERPEELLFALQSERSRIALPRAISIKEPKVRPDEGHYSSQLSLSYGNENSQNYFGLSWRPAYHGLLDMPGGYLPSSSLTFAESEFRYLPKDDRVVLEEFRAIELESFSSRTKLLKPYSWKIGGGARRYYFSSEDKKLILDTGVGGGLSYRIANGLQLTSLIESELLYGGRFKNNFELGLGASITLLSDLVEERLRLGLIAKASYLALGSDELTYNLALEQTLGLSKSNALKISLERLEELSAPVNVAQIQWIYYFF